MIDCGHCGTVLGCPRAGKNYYYEDEEIACGACGAVNVVGIDGDAAYVIHWTCTHGKDEETPCEACEACERDEQAHDLGRLLVPFLHNIVVVTALHAARLGGIWFADGYSSWRPGCGVPFKTPFEDEGATT